jgi:hypothetical protein
MDEARDLGPGAYLKKNGYTKPYALMKRHLKQVLAITLRHKAHGWETLENRYGGLLARVRSTRTQIRQYLSGKLDAIGELEGKRLKITRLKKGELPILRHAACYTATPSTVNERSEARVLGYTITLFIRYSSIPRRMTILDHAFFLYSSYSPALLLLPV